jgi:hypothetical protein
MSRGVGPHEETFGRRGQQLRLVASSPENRTGAMNTRISLESANDAAHGSLDGPHVIPWTIDTVVTSTVRRARPRNRSPAMRSEQADIRVPET